MFGMDSSKTQGKVPPAPEEQQPGVIISPDTRRADRIPPGQSRTMKWPVLDASGAPPVALGKWRLKVFGLVENPVEWDWKQVQELPRVRVFSDFHCVTRWSRLGIVWEGISVSELVKLAGGLKPEAKYVVAHGYDSGWTTNLPLEDFLAEDALVAFTHDGEPITEEHGGPARLIIPQLYAWKSAKWLSGIEFLDKDRPGFWERNGYHSHGDPWKQERYGW
ncbi:MAG: sulfite oxidase-like oxidoreductase [Bryobacteraceae bacterium]